jgi:hypothetical protein
MMYQELAQTTEQALEELRKSTDEFSSKTQQDIAVKEVRYMKTSIFSALIHSI